MRYFVLVVSLVASFVLSWTAGVAVGKAVDSGVVGFIAGFISLMVLLRITTWLFVLMSAAGDEISYRRRRCSTHGKIKSY
jgi:hypothetical protein